MSTEGPSAINVVFEDDDNHETLLYSGETTLSPGKCAINNNLKKCNNIWRGTHFTTFQAILYPPNWNLEGEKWENPEKIPEPTTNSTHTRNLGHIGRRQALSALCHPCSLKLNY